MKRRNLKGMSLAEMVITVTLFGFIIMVMFNLFPSSISTLKHAECLFEASGIAQSLLEERKEDAFSKLDTPPSPGDRSGSHGNAYHYEFTPLTLTGVDTNYLKGVKVTVSWKERDRDYSMAKEFVISKIQR